MAMPSGDILLLLATFLFYSRAISGLPTANQQHPVEGKSKEVVYLHQKRLLHFKFLVVWNLILQ
jgi:hypothetical protein